MKKSITFAIPPAVLTGPIPSLPTIRHHVRLVIVRNGDITTHRVWIEGDAVKKWTPVAGVLLWENKEQAVTGALDLRLEARGGPHGSVSLVTICDGRNLGTINLTTPNGGNAQEVSYDL